MRFFLTFFFLLYCWQATLFGQGDLYYCVQGGGSVDIDIYQDYTCPEGQRITVIDSATGTFAIPTCNFGGGCSAHTCPLFPVNQVISTSPSTWTINTTTCKDGYLCGGCVPARPNVPIQNGNPHTPVPIDTTIQGIYSGSCYAVPAPPSYKFRFLPPPAASISSSAGNPICLGNTTVLTADCSGDICAYEKSYLWSNGATTSTITVTPGALGVSSYFVTISQGGYGFMTTCPQVASYDITATSFSATVDINGNFASSVTLTSCTFPYVISASCSGCGGGETYQWAGSGGFNSTNSSITVSGTGGGNLTVSENGCYLVKTINLNLGASPTATITPNISNTCVGATAPVVSSAVGNCAGCTYAWNSGENSANINISTASAQSAFRVLTVTNASGCVGTSNNTSVVVNDLPSLTLTGASICNGNTGSLSLTATNCGSGCSYNWTSGLSGTNPTVNPSSTTNYTVTVTNSYGCQAIATAAVSVNALPSLGFSGGSNETICSGSTTTISPMVSPVVGYLWTGGATTSTITANTPGVYSLTVTDANGCQAVNSKTIATSAGITPAFTPSTLALCPTGATTKPLQVGTYSSYLWSNGATTQGISVSSTGTYTVTVTSGGCTGTNTINVGMITPSAFVGIVASVNPVIGGNSTVISTSDPSYATYAWSSGQNTQSINVTPGATTTYTLTVTDANGCTALDALEITVTGASIPVVTVTPTLSICTGASANFGVTCTANCTGATYLWSNGATTANLSTSPGANTSYVVTVTNSGGGTVTANVSVSVHPSVTASVSISPNPVILGNAIVVSCNTITGASYTWSTGQTASSFSVTPSVNTIYAVTISNPGCQASNQAEATVSSPSAPVLTASPSAISICPGSVANFSVTCASNCTGATYLWSNGATTASTTASPASATNYTVTVTNSSSGVSTATVSVSLYASPIITFSGGASTTICAGNTATISITNNPAGATFLWSNAATTQSITANTSGTYTLTFTNASGCQHIASKTVTVNPSVTANVSITPNPVITGNAVAVSCNTITGASYTWSTGQTTSSFSVTPTVNTTYTVTITSNGCQGAGSGTVTVNTASAPTITVSKTPSVTAVCAGTVVTLQAGCTAGCTGITYLWSNGSTTASTTVSPNSTTTYTVTATNASSLTATGSLTVTTLARPTITIASTNPTNFCANQYFTITTGSVTGGTAPYTYAWSTSGATTANLTGLAGIAGTNVLYTVSVTSANGCVGTAGISRTPTTCNSGPRKVSILPNDTVCTGYPVTIAVDNPLSNPGFTWSTGQTGVAAITVFPTATTTYTVTVTTSNNPDTIISRTITVSPSTVGLSLSQPYLCSSTQTASLSITSAVCTYCQVQLYNSNGSPRGSLITGLPTTRTLAVADTGSFYAKIVGCDNNVSNVLNLGLASISPNIVVVPDTALCGGSDSATLIVSVPSNTSLVWSNGRTSSIITLGTSGVYTVTATNNATGCSGTASRTLTSVTGLNTNFNTVRRGSARPLRYCGSDIPDTLVPVLNHPNSLFYINNQLIANRVLNPASYAANTTHTIRHTIYDASTGCLSAQTDTFTINPNPVANFGSLASSYCVNHPSNVTVTVNPSGGTLRLNSRTTGNIVISNNYVLAPSILTDTVRSDTFRFSYSFVDGNGCGATSSVSTIIHPKPLVSMSPLGSNYCADPLITVNLNPNPAPASGTAATAIFVGGTTAASNFTVAGANTVFRPSAAGTATITYTYTSAFTNCTNVYTDSTNISGTSTANLYQGQMPNVNGSICLTDSVFMVTATRDIPAVYPDVDFYTNGNTLTAGIVRKGFMTGSPTVWVDTVWIKVNTAFFRQDTVLPFLLTYSLKDNICSKVAQRAYTLTPIPNLATNRPAHVCDYSKTQIDVRDLNGSPFLLSSAYTIQGDGFYPQAPFLNFITDSIPDTVRIRKHAFAITYTNASTGCTGYLRDSLEIKANPKPDIVGLNSVYCASGNVDTIFGVPSNGNWWVQPAYYSTQNSPPAPDSTLTRAYIIINPNTIGTAPIWYKVAYGNGCVNKVTDSIRVTNSLAIQIRNPANGFTSYCQNTAMVPLVITNQNNTRLIDGLQISLKNTQPPYNTLAGGIVSDTFINPAADTSSSGSTTYRIYAVYADASSGCSDMDTSTLVQIQAAPILRLSLANAVQGRYYCMSSDSAMVTVNSINGIAFTGAFSLSSNLSNISSTTTNPASVYLSTARVDTIRYIGGVGSITNCADTATAVIEIRTPPNSLSINGLQNKYCKLNDALNVGSLPSHGVTTSVPGLSTTIGSTSVFALPDTLTSVLSANDSIQNYSLAGLQIGNYMIRYRYTDEFGCVNIKKDSFKVHPNPIASFVSSGTCEGDSLQLISTSNFGGAPGNNTITTWGWTINQVLMPNNDTVATLASDAGLYQCGLTVTSNQGCQSDVQNNIPIIKYPKVDFQAFGGCQGDTVTFVAASTELRSTDTLTQYAWDFGDGSPIRQAVRVGNDSIAPQSYVYTTVGAFTPRLVLTNRNACTARDSLRLVVAPVVTLQQIIPRPPFADSIIQMPYNNPFEQANRIDWFPAQDTAESEWHWGWAGTLNGSEFIHTRRPNDLHQKILTTALGVSGLDSVTMFPNFDGRKASWLYSPCFDFTHSQKPMIKFDYTTDMRRLVTGAGLEFFNEQTGFWERLGENGNGVNWYNSTDVIGLFELPDTDVDNVPNNELHGWSDTSRWQTARYRLDQFRGKRNVRFRIVFSSIVPNTPNLGAIRAGIGFDNVWIGERQRSVLVEHFANVNHPNMEAINKHVYDLIFSNLNFRDVNLIQYHTGDNYYIQTSVSAREGLYNTQNNPNRYALNGFTTPNRLSTQLTAQELELEMLQDPTFVITPMNPDPNDQVLKLMVDIPSQSVRLKAGIKAVANLPDQLYNIHPVITEHFIDDQIADTLMGVFRAFLPINTGIPYRRAWAVGDTVVIDQSWNITPGAGINPTRLAGVLFIQEDTLTKKVHQAVSTFNFDVRLVTSVDNPNANNPQQQENMFSLNLFPNPAQEQAFLRFEQPLAQDASFQVWDMTGKQLTNGFIRAGESEARIETIDFASGMYIVTVRDQSNSVFVQRKLTVIRP